MRRILLVLSVAALMAVMLVAMAMPAFASLPDPRPQANPPHGPPSGFSTDCEGGQNNAAHAVDGTSPSLDASAVDNPAGDALFNSPGYNDGNNSGLNNASESIDANECR